MMTSRTFAPLKLLTLGILSTLLSSGCNDPAAQTTEQPQLIESSEPLKATSSVGNLTATAVQEHYQVDIALLPSVIFRDSEAFNLDINQVNAETRSKLLQFLEPNRDFVRFGTMQGSDIKAFILSRMSNYLDLDLQVAGLRFDLRMLGGWPEIFVVTRDKGIPLEDDRNYRVAISSSFYTAPFPGYYFGDGLNFSFKEESGDFGSIRMALNSYLDRHSTLPPLDEVRGMVVNRTAGVRGNRTIAEIQGTSHLSPYLGYEVTTRGVITGVGIPQGDDANNWAKIPGRALPTEIIIQSPEPDADPRTSEAISVFLSPEEKSEKLEVGQFVEVTGVVHEVRTESGFSGTSIRNARTTELGRNQPLPQPILIGKGGRQILDPFPSRFVGDQNAREQLVIEEAIDFWESLEHMRVELAQPTVIGTDGGEESEARRDGRVNFIEIALMPEGIVPLKKSTNKGGSFYNPYEQDFNVEVVRMVNSPFASFFKPKPTPAEKKEGLSAIFEVGDRFTKNLVGILSFNKNTFGDGRMVFYPSERFENPRKDHTPLEDQPARPDRPAQPGRPKTNLVSTDDRLTIASWNVENMGGADGRSGSEARRREKAGQIIREHLKCPDILNLSEIQDNNGELVFDGSAADLTLSKLIAAIGCKDADYRPINIDPVPFADGGETGGNIRVAMLYNAKNVTFVPRGNPTATSETFVMQDGSLNQNPGRLSPNNPVLEGTRKPLVAEFFFKGKPEHRFFVIGNHFNSMLSEGSPLGAKQPYRARSERNRVAIAKIVRQFIEDLRSRDPEVKVIVAGDFNTYHQALSLSIMSGDFLHNMMTYPGLLPPDQWYTSNFGGNSGAIDYIFASKPLMRQEPEFQILHLNSNYMLRYSDHDPLIARFKF